MFEHSKKTGRFADHAGADSTNGAFHVTFDVLLCCCILECLGLKSCSTNFAPL